MLSTVLFALLQAPVRPAVERFAIDPSRSTVGFRGSSDLHDFEGRTRNVAGELLLDAGDPRRCAVGAVLVLARSLDTDSTRRDSKMRDLLEADTHAHIAFELGAASDPLPAEHGEMHVQGTFVVRGIPLPKVVAVALEHLPGGALRVHGEASLAMSDFGIEPPSVLFLDTDDEVEAFWDLVLEPVPSARVSARTHALSVVSEFTGPGEAPQRSERRERFFVCDDGVLWDRGETWHVAGGEGRSSVDLARARALPAPSTAEETASELARERERIAARYGVFAGDVARERVDRLLAFAPPDAPPEIARTSDGFSVRLGGETWLEVSGRIGEGDFGACLAGIEGLPESVRTALAELDGVPERVFLRTATLAGTETLEIRASAAQPGELCDWALTPSRWIRVGAH